MDEILHTLQKLFSYTYISSYQSPKKVLLTISQVRLSLKFNFYILYISIIFSVFERCLRSD